MTTNPTNPKESTMAEAIRPSITATRIRKGKRAVVAIAIDGLELDQLGGARAERAACAVVCNWQTAYPEHPWAVGLRGNLEAGVAEARRAIRPATPTRIPCDWAVAVPVVDA